MAEGTIATVTDQNFREFLSENPRAVLVLGDPSWCHPCEQYDAIIAQVSAKREDLAFGHVNLGVGGSKGIKQQMHLKSMPTTVVYENGKLLDQHIGLMQSEELFAYLKQHFT